MYNFIKTKIHRGRKRLGANELSTGSFHINRFSTKRRLKDPKMKKSIEKMPKIN